VHGGMIWLMLRVLAESFVVSPPRVNPLEFARSDRNHPTPAPRTVRGAN
jgi:hypothetical protein